MVMIRKRYFIRPFLPYYLELNLQKNQLIKPMLPARAALIVKLGRFMLIMAPWPRSLATEGLVLVRVVWQARAAHRHQTLR